MSDIHFNSVVLLTHCDGVADSTTFTDSSIYARTLTGANTARVSSASKFGTGSLIVDAVGSWVTAASSDDFAFGTGDFTVETFAYFEDFSTGPQVISRYASFTPGFWAMGAGSSRHLSWARYEGGITASTALVPYTTWTHLAVSRVNGVTRGFVGGVLAFTLTDTANYVPLAMQVKIGATANGTGNNLTGKVDEVRITKGVGRYTSAFTPPTAAFEDTIPSYASLTAPMAQLTFDASPPTPHAEAALVAPSAQMAAYGGAFSSLSAPSSTIQSFSGGYSPPFTAPSPLLRANGHSSFGEQAAFLTAPSPLLSITTGANGRVTAPSPTLAITATVTGRGNAALTAPEPTISAAGKVSVMAGAALSAPSPNLVGYGGAVCSITLTGKALLQATGTTGGVAGVTLTCPLFELTTGATRQAFGSANLLCPSPELGRTAQAWLMPPTGKLTAIGTAVVTASYEAYAVNLLRSVDRNPNNNYIAALDEVTHYTNYPFTHVVRYQGSYYGANSTGLYLLEGTTDDGAAIAFAVKTAVTDFKTPNKKTLASAYFSGRFGPASTISLHEGEKAPNTYSFTTPRGTLAQNHRQKFGKGTKGRYFALSVSGTGTCELDGIEPEVHQLTRRI